MKVNVISESAFTVQGHGVHTAFTENIAALQDYTDCDVAQNTGRPADVVHIHTIGLYALSKLFWGQGVKVVSAHVTADSFVGSLVGAKYWYGLAAAYLRWFYNRADAVLAVSQEVVADLAKMGVRKPVYLVPNTIKTQAFATNEDIRQAARERLGIPSEAFVVLGSGQVQPRKRIDSFVAAAKAVPQAQFVWVGGMPFKQFAAESGAMEAYMKHPPENVDFVGLLPRGALIDYYRAANLFFLPSDQETFGIVIVEAAAAGLPVLLRDLDQYRQTFGDGYEKGTDETFGRIIERFRVDHEYYAHWHEAVQQIAERYDAKTGAVRLMEVYNEVLSHKVGSSTGANTKTEA